MISQIYHTILYQPIFNLLVFFYNLIPGHDLGVAILLITIVLKIVLYPFSVKSIKSQRALQDLQPQVNDLRKKYKDNPQELTKQTMALYKQQKVSPFSSCLPVLVQLPIFIAVYQVFRQGLANSQNLNILYPFIKNPGLINTVSFGFFELSKPNLILALLAGLAQFWVSKMLVVKKQPAIPSAKDENMTAALNKQMLYFMPVMTVFIGISLPSGLTFYWFVTTLLTGLQQWYIFKKLSPAYENNGEKNH